ncbi:PLDc N-terminal domain-containing protein [Litoribacter ruber]|uniref:PLDc N-terminal domain-containing protein n=1 Tax=Litoribacter ruber TaxID=702568 RepID=UPI001BD9AA17|nr:PLDc N-terminal domain-containing protein [Litoribacter ruber]MBT0812247.1 PLDc N-terminal domain-containing protein [Litoribacter ruber]
MDSYDVINIVGLCAVILLCLMAVIDINVRVYRGKKRSIYWIWLVFFFPILGPLLYFQLRDRV